MEFFELLTVAAIFIGMPWVVFTGVAKVKGANRSGGGSEIRRSELQAMIRDAVDDAIPDIERRLQSLEAIAINEDLAQDRIDSSILADALDHDEFDDHAKVGRRRERS
ncbi:hypothetical protein [Rubrivirga sp. IMCC45206]|uniref:hypothetical protein n=1 Tax=Rubrivirga sp. IMCC45206 TaxID=3391614 RepID=UPI00398FC770